MKPSNKFLVSGYYSPEYFCDRDAESDRIISAIKNERNITVFSIRRLGKTGLIEHVFYRLRPEKNIVLLYMDILPTLNLGDFINMFASAVLNKLESKPERIIKKIGEIFANLRPTISIDPATGMPYFQLNIQSAEEADKTLSGIFNYIKQNGKRVVIAIDEFQQITNYPEKQVEALLRTNIQRARNCNFIFSGSRKHILMSIFSQYGKPFYQSTEMMQLERIEESEYSKFIISSFKKGGKKIGAAEASLILNTCRRHTYYVQYLCNRLYGLNAKVITESLILEIFKSVLKENEAVFVNYRSLLTSNQWSILKAIASEGNAKLIMSKNFISKYNLGTPSSVHTAVNALLDKEMIYKEGDGYFVYDVYLEKWLKNI